MKKALFVCMTAVMLLCSFNIKSLFKSKSAETTTEATSSTEGKAAGKALKALYTQYKADGTFDCANLSNITNTMVLIKNCKNLKTQGKDTDYWTSFAAGLVLGSDNLVTDNLSSSVMGQLSNLMENVDTSKIESESNNTLQAASTVKEAAGSIQTLLGLFN